jgi:hypothetical protein
MLQQDTNNGKIIGRKPGAAVASWTPDNGSK